MDERIFTLHPAGKKGVNILLSKYETIKNAMLEIIQEHGTITYSDLNDICIERLQDTFDGKIPWYVVTVKLDLEAREVIEFYGSSEAYMSKHGGHIENKNFHSEIGRDCGLRARKFIKRWPG